MELIDITQELFHSAQYPGDAAPEYIKEQEMEKGELYNLSSFSTCSHNGTHIDAPAHFLQNGKTVDQMPLKSFVGPCYVAYASGPISAQMARDILSNAEKTDAADRILIGGTCVVTEEAARVFAEKPVLLLGNESQSVGPMETPMAVHLILLQKDVVLLEGIRLQQIPEGRYFLNAAPLKLGGLEGAPCRAWLIKEDAK